MADEGAVGGGLAGAYAGPPALAAYLGASALLTAADASRRGSERAGMDVPLKEIRHAGGARPDLIPAVAARRHPHLTHRDAAETAWAARMLTDGAFFASHVDEDDLALPDARPCALSEEDDAMLLRTGVAVPCPRSVRRRVVSRAYKVLKSDGCTSRLILPCVALNRATSQPASFRIAAPREVARWLRRAGAAASADGTNWFYQFALPDEVRRLFAYRMGPSPRLMAVLVMGHTQSPRIAHSLMCALAGATPLAVASDLAVHPAMVIIDNVLVAGLSRRMMDRRLRAFREACADSSAVVTLDGDPSVRAVTHGGVRYALRPLRWHLKPGWAERFAAMAAPALSTVSTWGWWRSAIGSAVWACRVLEVPLAVLVPVWRRLRPHARADDPGSPVTLDDGARRAWSSFVQRVRTDPWVRITRRRPFRVWLWADASNTGAGWVWYHPVSGWSQGRIAWTAAEAAGAAKRMPWAEARATRAAARALIRSSLPLLRACVIIVTDCLPWFHALRSGSPRSSWLAEEYLRLADDLSAGRVQYRPAWCDTRCMLADGPSRGRRWSSQHPIPYPTRMSRDHLPFAAPCAPPTAGWR